MIKTVKNSFHVLAGLILFSCTSATLESAPQSETLSQAKVAEEQQANPVQVGAQRTALYLPLLEDKQVAIVANQTSFIGDTHLVDSLLSLGVDVKHVYAPEHGFRGNQDAGAHVEDERDAKTGLSIYSLHGSSKKPSDASLADIDVVLFDIQDVGVRFYTYISSLHYVMEACSENKIQVIVLDRPNPHAHYIDGPTLEQEHQSFVGMHSVPVVYGMTIGEYARMINGEGWLEGGVQCDLKVITCLDYHRDMEYVLPIAPSPNLPNQNSIRLYPSLCFFEGTVASIGRGTDYPFQLIGHPSFTEGEYTFTPQPNGGAQHPKLQGESCFGRRFSEEEALAIYRAKRLHLEDLKIYHDALKDKTVFFLPNHFIDLLAGTSSLRLGLTQGQNLESLREEWQSDLEAFRKVRTKYLVYP